jgi:glycosyltransferase involved in cell wall biosynthesis
MKVGIDATWARVSGSGTASYTSGLVKALATRGECQLVLYFQERDSVDNPLFGLAGPTIERRVIGGRGQLMRTLVSLSRECARDRLDVFHSPGYFLPLWPGPKVVTFHDVNMFLQWDKWWRPGMRRSWLALCSQTALSSRLARCIAADSHYSGDQIGRVLRISSHRIRVLYPGIDDIYFKPPIMEVAVPIRNAHNLQEYLLFVGVLSPIKNIESILRAFALVDRPALQLAIVGRHDGTYFQEIIEPLIDQLGVRHRVRVLGRVPADVLPGLYAGAQALVFPSFAEGFGLPPLEAMACGTPVIASNRPSFPEVLGDAAVLVDPTDIAGLATEIHAVVSDAALCRSMVARGKEQASKYRWDVSASRMLDVYSSAMNSYRN